jgi:hypothetical protein
MSDVAGTTVRECAPAAHRRLRAGGAFGFDALRLGLLAAAVAIFSMPLWLAAQPATATVAHRVPRADNRALISYELPASWQVQGERYLEKIGFISAPYPVYISIGGAEPPELDGVANPPNNYAFSETPSPWFMASVITGPAAAPPPDDAYRLAPDDEVRVQEQQSGLVPKVLSLSPVVDVRSGGLTGSEDRSEIVVPGAGNIELNGVVYAKGKTVWLLMVGCSLTCYNANAATVAKVIDSVKVSAD